MRAEKIAVIGGGLMGAGIAQVFAAAGHAVALYEPSAAVRARLPDRLAASLSGAGADAAIAARIAITADLAAAAADACYITEAVPERLELKQAVFADLEAHASRDATLASNTSVIPISHIAQKLRTPQRVVGTHWWNPAHLIPLVEVVQAEHTSQATVDAAMAMLRAIGKHPAHIRKDTPGFVANRLQHALWREAIAMVAEGICDAETLDQCVKTSFGLRLAVLGPLENADLVGLDLTLDIHRTIMPALDRHDRPHALLEQLVSTGHTGVATHAGFRSWTDAQIAAIRERLVRHLLAANTAAADEPR